MKVGVIGNGIAGFSAASTLRRLSDTCQVTMIAPETTPLYSACVLPDYIAGKIPRENTFVKTPEEYEHLGIDTLFGREVCAIDPSMKVVTLDDGRVLKFDKLILALGSDPIVFGERKEGIYTLKTLGDADAMREHTGKKAAVIGAGAIGIEVATALHQRGYEVTIIEMLARVLPLGLDQRGADTVREILEENGITVFTGERAVNIVGRDCVEALVTDKREVPCDTLIWAVGMRPSVEVARQAGITTGDKGGIRVDSHMETTIPGIYACGDCVESNDILTGEPYLNLFWHNANRQGSVAAYNCFGIEKEYTGSQNMLNVDIFGNHVVGFGFTEADLYRFKDIKALKGKLDDVSIIEREEDGSYYRLVVVGDRCMGGQFINIAKDLGLVWSIMFQKKSITALRKTCESEELMRRRPWVGRLRPFLKTT